VQFSPHCAGKHRENATAFIFIDIPASFLQFDNAHEAGDQPSEAVKKWAVMLGLFASPRVNSAKHPGSGS
jgi:hypothetical protein